MKKQFLLVPFMVAAAVFSGCGVEESTSSELDIVNGRRVSANSGGVERMGTVYLGNCTATAIAKDLVLTAAHCVGGNVNVYFLVGNSGVQVPVQNVVAHPNYRYERSPNTDIALIKLARKMPSTHRVVPLLTNASRASAGKGAFQAGYGSTKDGYGRLTDTGTYLRKAWTRITSHQITSTGGSIGVKNGSTVSGGTAACSGDSGGPLYVKVNGRWFTAGVTSTAVTGPGSVPGNLNCAGGNYYASIAGNYKWLRDTARKLTNNRKYPFDAGGLLYN